MLGAGALGRPRGMVWGGRREEGSGWGTHVYLGQIHFDIWQNQYNIVKFKNKIKLKKIKKERKKKEEKEEAVRATKTRFSLWEQLRLEAKVLVVQTSKYMVKNVWTCISCFRETIF